MLWQSCANGLQSRSQSSLRTVNCKILPWTEIFAKVQWSNRVANLRSDGQIAEVLRKAEEIVGGLSDWQRSFCTPQARKIAGKALQVLLVLGIYLDGRKGDPYAAAEILAKSLIWREHAWQDVLTGSRLPKWQGDFRLLSQSDDGHPLLYLCCRHQHRAFNVRHTLEHVAVVLETAIKTMPPLVQQAHVMMVDAPVMIQPVWSIVYPLLPPATQRKFKFLSANEAKQVLQELQGYDSASTVWQVMQDNRGSRPPKPQIPSFLAWWEQLR
eukprot:Skav202592  [mRNA]  locus=scaffold1305:165515:172218:- [translate_table: standard]